MWAATIFWVSTMSVFEFILIRETWTESYQNGFTERHPGLTPRPADSYNRRVLLVATSDRRNGLRHLIPPPDG